MVTDPTAPRRRLERLARRLRRSHRKVRQVRGRQAVLNWWTGFLGGLSKIPGCFVHFESSLLIS